MLNPPASVKRDRRTAKPLPEEPETTASVSLCMPCVVSSSLTSLQGVVPGRALLDTPSPGTTQPELDRSQRTRKASSRKLEACTYELPFSGSKRTNLIEQWLPKRPSRLLSGVPTS